ncbi:MAG TPA: hypothetical protein GX505_07675 [Clostridiales bacterium]|nr:hypothetical protein [Clostridiales bacterium]
MYRVWGILKRNNKIIADMVAVCENSDLADEDKLQECILKICNKFDLQKPMWLHKNEREFAKYNRAVLNQDNFIESISFDTFELELLEDK